MELWLRLSILSNANVGGTPYIPYSLAKMCNSHND